MMDEVLQPLFLAVLGERCEITSEAMTRHGHILEPLHPLPQPCETQTFSVNVWRVAAICDIHLSVFGPFCSFSHAQLLTSRRLRGGALQSFRNCFLTLIWSDLAIDFKVSCKDRSVCGLIPCMLLIPSHHLVRLHDQIASHSLLA